MEVPKKRKRDVDCPRITYDTSTKMFDRLFKEESLEEMKNVVRKKLGLSSSLPVHLSQLRDGKPIVLEDDDDFDAFYASIHSAAVAKIMVYLGDDQPSRACPDAGFTGGPMQLLGSPTIHHAAADDHSPSKRRKVSFVESTPQPVGNNVEEPNLSQSLPNSEPRSEVPATLDVNSADTGGVHGPSEQPAPATLDVISPDSEEVHETSEQPVPATLDVIPPDTGGVHETSEQPVPVTLDVIPPDTEGVHETSEQPVGNNVEEPNSNQSLPDPKPVPPTLDVISADTEGAHETSKQPVGNNVEEPDLNQFLPNSEPPSEVPATLDVISADAADTRKGPEELQRHTPFIGQVDPSGVDVSTRPPKETKKSQNRMEVVIVGKESNAALSGSTSKSTVTVQRAKKQDPRPPASTSALQATSSDSKGKTKRSERSQPLTTPSKPTPRVTLTRKSRKKEVPAEPPEANDKDQALNSATRVAVDAILGKFFSSNVGRETPIRSSPLVDATGSSPPIAPVAPLTSPDDQPVPPNNTTITKQFKTAPKCPVCNKTPYHYRSRCPIIRAGPKAIRQRMAELQRNTLDGNEEEREKLIEELQRIIDKRTKRNQTPARENKSTNAISMADNSVTSPSVAADSSSIMVDELRYSSDSPDPLPPAQIPATPAVVNGVSNELDPLFLHSESQQSFPYSQYPNIQPPDSEDEEDEVQASVVKLQTTKSSSTFRSLTEIASQPTLFTPTRPTQINHAKEEVINLYGRTNREEESDDSDSDSESDSDAGAKAQTSHIPLSRRAGTLPSKRR